VRVVSATHFALDIVMQEFPIGLGNSSFLGKLNEDIPHESTFLVIRDLNKGSDSLLRVSAYNAAIV
jgi:hypothetical protein